MKKLVNCIFMLCCALLLSVSAMAASSGPCGKNLTWTLDDAGTLTISGTGEMWNWNGYSDYTPWYFSRSSIKSVRINDDVTSIGDYAFRECSALTSVIIPEGMTNIGESAFSGCSSLRSAGPIGSGCDYQD